MRLGSVVADVKRVEEWAPPVAGALAGGFITTQANGQIDKQIAANAKWTADQQKQAAIVVRVVEAVIGIVIVAATVGRRGGASTFGLTAGAVTTGVAGSELVQLLMS